LIFSLVLVAAALYGVVYLLGNRSSSIQNSVSASIPTETTSEQLGVQPATEAIQIATSTAEPAPTATIEYRGGGAHGQIAFASDRDGRPQIWLVNVDGSGEEQLTNIDGGACQPEWSPAGTMLIFTSPCNKNQKAYEDSAIYLIDMFERTAVRLTSGEGGDFDPTWSPDGGKIVFTSLRNNNRPQLYFYDWLARTETFFSLSSAYMYQADWSPAGDQLVFVTTAIGPELLFTASATDHDPIQFLREDMADGKAISSPKWAPDGQAVYYTITPASGGFSQLYYSSIADAGFTKQLLIKEGIPGRDLTFSPDGTLLAFESWPNTANHNIWIVASDGSGLMQVTTAEGNDFDPAWRP
jgi:Tol biopolymer transport system component